MTTIDISRETYQTNVNWPINWDYAFRKPRNIVMSGCCTTDNIHQHIASVWDFTFTQYVNDQKDSGFGRIVRRNEFAYLKRAAVKDERHDTLY